MPKRFEAETFDGGPLFKHWGLNIIKRLAITGVRPVYRTTRSATECSCQYHKTQRVARKAGQPLGEHFKISKTNIVNVIRLERRVLVGERAV